jgi:hypothetical protein
MKTRLIAIMGIMAAGLSALAQHAIQPGNIGIAIAARRNAVEPLRIGLVFRGSPAEAAGVKTNWLIISINGTNVVSESSMRCMNMLHGPVGTSMTLELADPKMTQTNKFIIERADVDMGNLFQRMFGTNKPAIPQQGTPLTSEQATTLALQLANDQAATLYHSRPFQEGQPAKFTQGHWVWSDACGYGRGDIYATVELAADGSTNLVNLQLLDSQNPLFNGSGGRRGF